MAVKDRSEERDDVAEILRRTQRDLRELQDLLEQITGSFETARSPLTVAQLAERFDLSEDVLVAFAQTIGELLDGRELDVPAARRAALIAASGQAWESELGPLLSTAQVRELLGGISRQRVDELLRGRRLIGLLDSAGRRRFPAFQFADGRPIEPLVAAFWTIADATESEWTAASWCVAPDDALGGRSPHAWALEASDHEPLLRVARQDAARLAR